MSKYKMCDELCKNKAISIGKIGNYYGNLEVKQDGDKFYWRIEDWCETVWEEIPEYLYTALCKFEEGGIDP